jgi:hypothetical protein
VNALFKNPKMPLVPYYAWSEGALAGELLGPYFHNVRMRLDSFDVYYRSSTAMFDYISTWNPPIRMAMEGSAPDVCQKLREGCIGIIDRFNRATDGTLMANMNYAIVTGVRSANADTKRR